MFVLGIDPGLTRTGFGLVRRGPNGIEAVGAGVIRTEAATPTPIRLAELREGLRSVIDEHRPTAMAIETVFTNRNRATAISVGRASGVALLAAGEAGIPVTEYTPTAIKLAIAGSGRADKKAVQLMVGRRLSLKEPPRPADAADALAIAICHLQSLHVAGRIG